MTARRTIVWIALCTVLCSGCGQDNQSSGETPVGISDPNGFLLFPNPLVQSDGSSQSNTTAYAQAYYAAVDPANERTTINAWKARNGFGSGTGQEVSVVFRDVHDLGYGRRMTFRQNADGSIAAFVENFVVEAVPGQRYTTLNVEAAVRNRRHFHIGTNAIEFSGTPGSRFAKFFTFAPSGERLLTANLDGRGQKAMPGICINCHGGRADPLTRTGLFPNGGNTRAKMQPLKVDSFEFSNLAGYTRADQESAFKTINQIVLCTYPLGAASALTEDLCRPVVSANEWGNQWQATAAEMVKSWYGGDGMPNAGFSDTYVPSGWSGQTALYQGVVAPYCRTCHILRGTANQNDISFMTYDSVADVSGDPTTRDGFRGYADRIKAHVIDRGNMPLALIVYDRFWESGAPELLATFLEGEGYTVRDGGGAVLRPGRPIADPGPDRTTNVPVTLSAANSSYATSYAWTLVASGSCAAASLSNASSVQPTFTAANGSVCQVQLVVSNGATPSGPATLTLTVDNTMSPAPSAIRFSDVKSALQAAATTTCVSCHNYDSDGDAFGGIPPIYYGNMAVYPTVVDFDRDGDSDIDADDDTEFYLAVRGRINFNDINASPLLRKPTGNHHNGGWVLNTSSTTACAAAANPWCNAADPDRDTWGEYYQYVYNLFVNWIVNGAPQ